MTHTVPFRTHATSPSKAERGIEPSEASASMALPYVAQQLRTQISLPSLRQPERLLVASPEADDNEGVFPNADPGSVHNVHPALRPQKSMPFLQPRSPEHQPSIPSPRDRSQTTPLRTDSPSSYLAALTSEPNTPRVKPQPARLDTANLKPPAESPEKPLSPGLQHWQQVRQHVVTSQDQATPRPGRRMQLVVKAAGRLGLRQNSDQSEKRQSSTDFAKLSGELTVGEREYIARQRARFAGDVKLCLDACAEEERKRRLQRRKEGPTGSRRTALTNSFSTYSSTGYAFDHDFSSFAPLLMELHRHLPDARAKRPWSRTCPHHAAILEELGNAFLQDGLSTAGERQQALEVFGVIVRTWAPDNEDEELDRWSWLIRALLMPDRALQNRGLSLLTAFFNRDPSLPSGPQRPKSAFAVQHLAGELIELLQAVDMAAYDSEQQIELVRGLMKDLTDGRIIQVSSETLSLMLDEDHDGVEAWRGGGAERELAWTGIAKALGQGSKLADWLLKHNGAILKAFSLPPLLHATHPIIIQLRSRSMVFLLASFTKHLRMHQKFAGVIWHLAETLVLPELDILQSGDANLSKMVGIFLLQLELIHQNSRGASKDSSTDEARTCSTGHRDILVRNLQAESWREGTIRGAIALFAVADLASVMISARELLDEPVFSIIGEQAVQSILERVSANQEDPQILPFLLSIQQRYPRLFYKSLFSLSASTSIYTASAHLATVKGLMTVLGSARFWLNHDAQMVVIVLTGSPSSRAPTGPTIPLGRYLCLLELIDTLDLVLEDDPKRFRTFLDAVENGLSVKLQIEDWSGEQLNLYRSLICGLVYRLRMSSQSTRKPLWQRRIIDWYSRDKQTSRSSLALDLEAVYASIPVENARLGPVSSTVLHQNGQSISALKYPDHLLNITFCEAAEKVLVMTQASLSAVDINSLTPVWWSRLGREDSHDPSLSFLLMKSAEIDPQSLREMIMAQLGEASERVQAINRLEILWHYRSGITLQPTINHRRGPLFQFPQRNNEIVMTEIGSSNWVAHPDAQDAALDRFGRGLPVELRQKLMDLGWTDQVEGTSQIDRDQILAQGSPATSWQEHTHTVSPEPPRSPGATGTPQKFKSRKVFAPVLLKIIIDQAIMFSRETDKTLSSISQNLVNLLQREDPMLLLRPINDQLAEDFLGAQQSLEATCISSTPAFSYLALNALVGFLKAAIKHDPSYPHFAAALTSISRIVPGVSETSLRDIRKNKVEHILLPASIHEGENGFTLHVPWQEGNLEVQTAQLVLLEVLLEANPRDVYLVKKMMSNLPVLKFSAHLPFARAWLRLVLALFSRLNRNYNDRAELRHFLTNVAHTLRNHGPLDMDVARHALRILMLSSARFRRLFASMGITTVMRSVYETYAVGRAKAELRDGIEYAVRSFYRIHRDHFVHQTCIIIAEGDWDGCAVYELLVALAQANDKSCGVPSSLKGLNDKEEHEALLQMEFGPDMPARKQSKEATDRLAVRIAGVDMNGQVFPRENIVRLFMTVVASRPTTNQGIQMIKLLGGITRYIQDSLSRSLLKDGIDALGNICMKGKALTIRGEALSLDAGDHVDWSVVRTAYLGLVLAFVESNGALPAALFERVLQMAVNLINEQRQHVGSIMSSIIGHLAQTHLASRPLPFLKECAAQYRGYIAIINFSSLLQAISDFVLCTPLNVETTNVIVDCYINPAIQLLVSASEADMALILPIRPSLITLLAAILPLDWDVFAMLERHVASASLVAAIIFPLSIQLHPQTPDDLWLRVLNYVVGPFRQQTQLSLPDSARARAALAILSVQVIKVVIIRAPKSISLVEGLWNYLARHLETLIETGRDTGSATLTELADLADPSVYEWMAWSLYRFIGLLQSPLRITFEDSIVRAVRDVPAGRSRHQPKLSTLSKTSRIHLRKGSNPRFPSSLSVGSAEGNTSQRNTMLRLFTPTSPKLSTKSAARDTVRDNLIDDDRLIMDMEEAIRTCQGVFGSSRRSDPPEVWSSAQALDAISRETEILTEGEFQDIFYATSDDWIKVAGDC